LYTFSAGYSVYKIIYPIHAMYIIFYTDNPYLWATGDDSWVDSIGFSRADHAGWFPTGYGRRAHCDHENELNFQGLPPRIWHPAKCVHGGGDALLSRRWLGTARLDYLRTATAVAVENRKCENSVFGWKSNLPPWGTLSAHFGKKLYTCTSGN